jgi:hypothetical protein
MALTFPLDRNPAMEGTAMITFRKPTKLTAAAVGVALAATALGAATVADAMPTRAHSHATAAAAAHPNFPTIRAVTRRFHNIARAEKAGYVPFADVHGVSCIAMSGMGGMGVHYVNPKLISDPRVDRRHPEALVYAPAKDGTLHLAAVEYLVDKKTWDSTHTVRPHLFAGHPFNLTTAPNRFGLPAFYSQHVWAWRANPAGGLKMWNPTVHCRFA